MYITDSTCLLRQTLQTGGVLSEKTFAVEDEPVIRRSAAVSEADPQDVLGAGKSSDSKTLEATLADLGRRNVDLAGENERLTEAIEARDTFLAVAAHELRNPMMPILGRVQLLRRMMEKRDFQLSQVEKNLAQIEWLIGQYIKRATILLDVSRITSGKLRLERIAVDASGIGREVAGNFEPIAQHANIELRLELPSEGVTVICDPLALEQILDNLVSNAIKYGTGKFVLLRASVDAERGVALLCVEDDGPGISPADQARIFERFERATAAGEHRGGFGVGLWIVRQLTEAMSGSIEVTSRAEGGSIFCITLPLHAVKDPE